MNKATLIILKLIQMRVNDYGHNDEICIYTADEIEQEAMMWCVENSDCYDEEWYPILMVEDARKTVDFEAIAKQITEEKKVETLEWKEWLEKIESINSSLSTKEIQTQ